MSENLIDPATTAWLNNAFAQAEADGWEDELDSDFDPDAAYDTWRESRV